MSKEQEELYIRLGRLVDIMEEGYANNLSFGGNQRGSASISVGRFSRNFNSDYMDIDEFEQMKKDIYERENPKKYDSSLDEYLDKKEELNKLTEKESALEDEVKATLAEKAALLEKQRQEGLKDEEIERLEELISLSKEYNETYRDRLRLTKELEGKNTFNSFTKDVGNAVSATGNLMNSLKGVKDFLLGLTNPYNKINAAASQYAKSVGLTGVGMENFEKQLLGFAEGSKIIETWNMSPEEAAKMNMSYAQKTGKVMRMSNEDFDNAGAARLLAGEEKFVDLAAKLENFGLSATDTAQKLGKMHAEAAKNGLSFEAYSSNIANNIKMAQNYTFKNGIKGLESMAKKATAMKLDMQQMASFADKVSTVEGAIETSARLQVLGGPFAQFADPMSMLNEGLNDMEGLQDRVIKMTASLGRFDKERGEVVVSTGDRLRVKEAAAAMGMDYSNLMESVHAQGKRNEIAVQIENSAAAGFDKELKELIMNTGTFKDGKAGVSVNGTFTALEDLDPKNAEELRKLLIAESRSESEDVKDIAFGVRSMNDKIEGHAKLIEALQADMFKEIAEGMLGVLEWLNENKGLLKAVLAIAAAIGAANVIGGMMGGLLNLGKGLWKVAKGGFNMLKKGATGVFKYGKKIFSKGGAGAANVAKSLSGTSKSVTNATKGMTSTTKGLTGTSKSVTEASKSMTNASRTMTSASNNMSTAVKTIDTKAASYFDPNVNRWRAPNGQFVKAPISGVPNTVSVTKNGKIWTKALNVGKNALGKVSSTVATGANMVKRKAVKTGVKAFGAKGLRHAAKVSKVATPLGLAGAGLSIGSDLLAANGLIEYGGTAHKVMRVGGDALSWGSTGAAIGSVFGPVGTAVGGLLGAVAGGLASFFGFGDDEEEAPPPKPRVFKIKNSSIDILNDYVGKVKPVLDKGAISTAQQVARTNNDVHVSTDPYDIELNGTLMVKGENGQSIDLVSELKNNPIMKRQLAEMISNEMNVINNGGYIAQGV